MPNNAIDLLDKTNNLYSDRPTLMMAGKLVGWDNVNILLPFGDTWKEHRRLFAQFMGTRSKIDAFLGRDSGEMRGLLHRLLMDPAEWYQHTRRCVILTFLSNL